MWLAAPVTLTAVTRETSRSCCAAAEPGPSRAAAAQTASSVGERFMSGHLVCAANAAGNANPRSRPGAVRPESRFGTFSIAIAVKIRADPFAGMPEHR